MEPHVVNGNHQEIKDLENNGHTVSLLDAVVSWGEQSTFIVVYRIARYCFTHGSMGGKCAASVFKNRIYTFYQLHMACLITLSSSLGNAEISPPAAISLRYDLAPHPTPIRANQLRGRHMTQMAQSYSFSRDQELRDRAACRQQLVHLRGCRAVTVPVAEASGVLLARPSKAQSLNSVAAQSILKTFFVWSLLFLLKLVLASFSHLGQIET